MRQFYKQTEIETKSKSETNRLFSYQCKYTVHGAYKSSTIRFITRRHFFFSMSTMNAIVKFFNLN